MKKWHRACLAGAGLASSLVIGYQSTRTEDVLTPQDVAAWQATGALHATSKPPVWRDFGLFLSLGLTGVSGWHLWRLLETESSASPPNNNNQLPSGCSPSPLPSPLSSPSSNSSTATAPTLDPKQELWQQLNQPETKWVLCLLEPPALLVKGGQGAFKTTFVGFLILLRKLYCGHSLEVSDPHAHQNEDKWFACRLVGHEQNYTEIATQLSHYFKRLKTRNLNSSPITSVWDEYTNYATRVPGDAVGDFLFSVLSDARKAREFPILIGHTDKKGGTGNGKRTGEHEMKEEQLLTLHLKAERDTFGHPRPAFRGFIKGHREDEDGNPIREPVQLQPWMNPQYLLQLFPELSYREKSDVASSESPMPQSCQPESKQTHPPVSWDYWVSESTDEEINRLIASRRLPPNQNLRAEISSTAPLSPEVLPVKPLSQSIDASRFSELYPEITEEAMMEAIYRALDSDLKPAEIVRTVLKCTSSQPGSNRHYSEVGKPVFCYLIRKHGTAALIAHFADFLDKSQS